MNKQQYIRTLERRLNVLEWKLKMLKDDDVEEFELIEEEIQDIKDELDELEDNVWGDTKEIVRSYMYDVIPHYYLY